MKAGAWDLGLPSDKAFGDELDDCERAADVYVRSPLAVAPEYCNTPVLFELTRSCLAHAMLIGQTDTFIAISPEHARFFEDVLLFYPSGDQRNYAPSTAGIGRLPSVAGQQPHPTGCNSTPC